MSRNSSRSTGKAKAPNTEKKGASVGPRTYTPLPPPPTPESESARSEHWLDGHGRVSQVCLSEGHLVALSGNAMFIWKHAPMKPLPPVALGLNAGQRGLLRLIYLPPRILKGC